MAPYLDKHGQGNNICEYIFVHGVGSLKELAKSPIKLTDTSGREVELPKDLLAAMQSLADLPTYQEYGESVKGLQDSIRLLKSQLQRALLCGEPDSS